MQATAAERRRAYWLRTLALTTGLLLVWALVTFVPAWWARELNGVRLFGWPLAFYMGAQGSLIVYVAIVWIYAHAMDRLDRQFGVDEQDRGTPPYPAEEPDAESEGDDDA